MSGIVTSNFVLTASEYNPSNEQLAYRDINFLIIPEIDIHANFKPVWRPQLYRWIFDNQENPQVIPDILGRYEYISENSPLKLKISIQEKKGRLMKLCNDIGWKTKSVKVGKVARIFDKIKEFYERYGRQNIEQEIRENYQQYASALTNNTEAPMTPVKGAAAVVSEGATVRAPNRGDANSGAARGDSSVKKKLFKSYDLRGGKKKTKKKKRRKKNSKKKGGRRKKSKKNRRKKKKSRRKRR